MTSSSLWRCSWQDYRGWPQKHNAPPPPVEQQEYSTKADADARASVERQRGMTVCVSEVPLDVLRKERKRRDAKKFNADWKLHQ